MALFLALAGIAIGGGEEQKIVDELNLARTQPAKYAKLTEKYKKTFIDDKTYKMPGTSTRIRTQEGKKAVDEAIAFLKKAKPVGKLKLSAGLSKAAAEHVKDLGKSGKTAHKGSDGSSPSERMNRHGKWQKTSAENLAFGPDDPRHIVMQLIIDDGVANRGHRTNIFNKDLKVVGVSVGDHKKYRRMCAMDFAGGFVEKK